MTEKKLHLAICKYIKLQYPNAYFMSDPSGLRMSIGMATQLKKTRSNHAQLDIIILEPNKDYKGLILEVKKDRSEVFKIDGEFRNSKHVKDQNESIIHLNSRGYKTLYIFTLDEAIISIDTYFKNTIIIN